LIYKSIFRASQNFTFDYSSFFKLAELSKKRKEGLAKNKKEFHLEE
jgi:hypothetical protein